MKRTIFAILAILLLSGCAGSPAAVSLSYSNAAYSLAPAVCQPKTQTGYDFQDLELKLENSQVLIYKNNQLFWQTDKDWQVDNLLVADANNDQEDEIILTLWKRGSFGTSRPFWVAENDQKIEHHLFLYGYQDGEISPLWHSSRLPRPIKELFILDINQDQKNELVELEGDYDSKETLVGVWQWQEWGFVNLWQSEAGGYKNFCLSR